jgi:hypothetical protein
MTTQLPFILDYETVEFRNSSNGDDRQWHKYRYQIDSRGNVKIQHMSKYWGDSWHVNTALSVVDNVPVPGYLVDMLKELVTYRHNDGPTWDSGFWNKNVINAFNKIKSGLKELANNSHDATDVKSQLDFSRNKNEMLQNELNELEQKIKNVQAAYADTLKDNEKLKQEKIFMNEKLKKEIEDLKVKNTKITEAYWKVAADVARIASEKLALEIQPEKSRVMRHYSEPEFGEEFKQPDYTPYHGLHDCFHNPGGATIYTKANAMNRMVFNPLSGIYESEEN